MVLLRASWTSLGVRGDPEDGAQLNDVGDRSL